MFEAFKRWRRGRVLAGASIPDGSWHEAVAELPFLADWSDVDLAKLRELVVLFLDAKSVIGAGGHEVTPRQRIVIAAQACVPVLELGLDWYEDFENVVVYPSEFVPGWTWRTKRVSCTRTTGRWPARRCPADRSCFRGRMSRRRRTSKRTG